MKEISDQLKTAREKLGKTLEEISAQTKIQLPTLQTLESGEFDKISNKAYLKGFIRQYARALHLNADELLATYNQSEPTVKKSKTQPIAKLDSKDLTNKTNVLWFRAPSQFITFGGIAIIILLTTAIYFFSMKMVSYSQETFKEPTTQSSGEPLKPSDTPQLESLINDKQDSLALPQNDAAAKNSTTDTPKEELAAVAADNKPKMVTVEAKDRVTIDAAWSTGKKETVKLSANNKHIYYYAEKIKLIISNGGVVKIQTHEKDLGIPGEAGKPITINFQ